MIETAFQHMQATLDIVGKSPHATNKVAATVFGKTPSGEDFSLGCFNHWPDKILDKIGKERKIGNSSGTIHAETACILKSPHALEGASICITDPFCPNCAKNIAEAGIKNIYLDETGLIRISSNAAAIILTKCQCKLPSVRALMSMALICSRVKSATFTRPAPTTSLLKIADHCGTCREHYRRHFQPSD